MAVPHGEKLWLSGEAPGWRARAHAYSITPGPCPSPTSASFGSPGTRGGIPRLSVGVHGPMPIRSHLESGPSWTLPLPHLGKRGVIKAWGLTHAPCCSDVRHDRMGKGSRHPICSHPLTSLRIAEARLLEHEARIQRRGGLIAVIDPIAPSLHQP